MTHSFTGALEAYLGGAVFVAFDLETTGLDPRKDHIVEIGAVKFDKNGPVARYSVLINPGVPMPPEAEKINKISDEMLKGKPSLDEVLPDFLRFIDGTALAAHNAPFDCGFINEKLKKSPGNPGAISRISPFPVIDTLILARELFPGLRSYSLQNLAGELRIKPTLAHRAEDDARLCMEILVRCMEQMPH